MHEKECSEKSDKNLVVHIGDCAASMRAMIERGEKVQMCVTSPPYYGLRSYLPDDHDSKGLEIGSEETPAQFIAKLVSVFRLVRELLADDGTLWVNMGDSYAGQRGSQPPRKSGNAFDTSTTLLPSRGQGVPDGTKPKDLIGIPWELALALRADGWFLRQDIIWSKPNPMPESVRDRCTKAHEYVFLLSKSPQYFFDSAAIREPASQNPVSRARRTRADFGAVGTKALRGSKFGQSGIGKNAESNSGTRNRRSVWTVATRPFRGAHFATFPPELIEPCILAGSRPGDTVLDPFGGSGTTAGVAIKHDRKAVLCELYEASANLVPQRIASIAGTSVGLFEGGGA